MSNLKKIEDTEDRVKFWALYVTLSPEEAKKSEYDPSRDELLYNGKWYPIDLEPRAVVNRLGLRGFTEGWIKSSLKKIQKQRKRSVNK